jgi:hypothetical protein
VVVRVRARSKHPPPAGGTLFTKEGGLKSRDKGEVKGGKSPAAFGGTLFTKEGKLRSSALVLNLLTLPLTSPLF